MAMSVGTGGGDEETAMSDINTTPLVDIMLVLLIIFLITVPVIQKMANVEIPKASMYIWAPIPQAYAGQGSLEFAKKLLADAKVAVSPGIGFGQYGDDHVRFALIENEVRHAALRGSSNRRNLYAGRFSKGD